MLSFLVTRLGLADSLLFSLMVFGPDLIDADGGIWPLLLEPPSSVGALAVAGVC